MSAPARNSAAVAGFAPPQETDPLAEMTAFDGLPIPVQRALRDSLIDFVAADVADLVRRYGAAATVRLIQDANARVTAG